MKQIKLRERKVKLRLNQEPDRVPPQQAAENARRGLECVEEVDTDAGEAKGRERAQQIIDAVENNNELSPETISDIASFDRHRAQGNHTVDEEFEGSPCEDNGFVSWKLWGGSAGVDWAQQVNESLSDNVRIRLNALGEGDIVELPNGDIGGIIMEGGEDVEIDDEPVEEGEVVVAYGSRQGYTIVDVDELSEGEIDTPEDVNPEDLEDVSANSISTNDLGFDSWPDSWEESEIPARLIALDAWSSMGGTWTGCFREIGSKRICSAFKDEMLGTTRWR